MSGLIYMMFVEGKWRGLLMGYALKEFILSFGMGPAIHQAYISII